MKLQEDDSLKQDIDSVNKIDGNKKRTNQREADLDFSHQTSLLRELSYRSADINKEIHDGLRAVAHFPRTVTIFGSARLKPSNIYYQKAKALAHTLADNDYAVITGGGPGIMQAGNEGTHEATGTAIGFGIELPHEQNLNQYVTHGINFEYFFTRKLAMNFSSKAYVCFPGGFGTMDEFFQILTLVQTGKIQLVPIILFGSDFWGPIKKYAETTLLEDFKTISPKDMDLFIVTDSTEETVNIIENAPRRSDFYS